MVTTEQKQILSVKDLQIYFNTDEGTVRAVDGVNFEIAQGKTLGVVGESGCGKSTVGRALLQILDRNGRINGGEINWVRGSGEEEETINIAKQSRNSSIMRSIRGDDIALVFQEPMTSFSPVHTIGNQLMEMIRLHKDVSKAEAKQRAVELLEMVHIPNPEQRVNEYSFQLSGGLRQRAMIAMALACEPKLLIADEPTTALDVTTQAQILDLMMTLKDKRDDAAILLITHDLAVVAGLADRICVMYAGRIVESGTVGEVLDQPLHPYTHGLIGSVPSHNRRGKRLNQIPGMTPSLLHLPQGCAFRTRCPRADDTCSVNPELSELLPGRVLLCHHLNLEMS